MAYRILITTLIGIFLSITALAEQSISYDDYTIHYSAFNTDTLSPEIAKSYQIQRSKNRIMVNLSVLKQQGQNDLGTSVKSTVTGTATNLAQQIRRLDLREINESGAIYYITDIAVNNEETLTFNFMITPDGEEKPYHLTFQQQFYTQ